MNSTAINGGELRRESCGFNKNPVHLCQFGLLTLCCRMGCDLLRSKHSGFVQVNEFACCADI